MILHLYALTDEPVDLAGGRGIDDAPLTAIETGGLHAVVTDHATAPAARRPAAVRHAAVVEVLARDRRALPVRFGVHHDRRALVAALDASADRLRRLLDQVAGRREYAVRASEAAAEPPLQPAPSARSGRAYLQQRLQDLQATDARRASQRQQLEDATAELVGLADQERFRQGPAGLERCFLVLPANAPAFERAAARLREPATELVVTGPWPPYSFADGAMS